MARKPPNLTYGVDDRPSFPVAVTLGLQHVFVVSIGFVLVVVVVRETGGGIEQARHLLQASMLALGGGTILQALHKGPIGSGYLCPPICSPSYVPPAILAIKTGGLPLMFGMTLFAGCIGALFSFVAPRLRSFFPPEVTGLVVAMFGLAIAPMGVSGFIGVAPDDPVSDAREVLIAAFTLSVMIGLGVWGRGIWRLFSVLVGAGAGYLAALLGGTMSDLDLQSLASAPVFAAPDVEAMSWSFDPALMLPFAIAGIAVALKAIGDLTACQKMNDANWKRSDMGSIGRGVLADATGTVAAGLLGGMGSTTSSSNIGVAIATGATSRWIAFAAGGLMIVFAFLPKVAVALAVMPTPVMGAVLVFAAGFTIVAGLQVMMSRMIDSRRTFVIGVSLAFGVSVDMVPQLQAQLPDWMVPLFSSSLSVALVTAVVLNFLFRIGTTVRRTVELTPGVDSSEKVIAFMDVCGASWGARPDVVHRATAMLNEFVETLAGAKLSHGRMHVEASFDEFNLDIDIWYVGTLIEFPATRPTPDEVMSSDTGLARLSAFLISRSADRIKTEIRDGRCHVRLHLDH